MATSALVVRSLFQAKWCHRLTVVADHRHRQVQLFPGDSPQHGAQVSSKEQTCSTTESVGLQFDDKFTLWDEETGEPLANAPYAIKRASDPLSTGPQMTGDTLTFE